MALSPSGAGYVCWRCELSAQIAEHERARPQRSALWRDVILLVQVFGICVGFALPFAIGVTLMLFSAEWWLR